MTELTAELERAVQLQASADWRRQLRRRRPRATGRFAYLLEPGDVIHAPIDPLEVLEPIRRDLDAGLIVITVRWWYPTGEPYAGELRHEPTRELLVSRL